MSRSATGWLAGPTRRPERAMGRAATVDAVLTPAGTVRIVVEDCDNDKELWVTLDIAQATKLRKRIDDAFYVAGFEVPR